jgi:hypothetical protein
MNKNIYNVVDRFLKAAQSVDADYSLIDGLRKSIGPKITEEAGNFLNNKAVSSIPVRISWNKPKAEFVVESVGKDSAEVNAALKKILDAKFSGSVSAILRKAKENSFSFNLLTVE